MAKCSVEILLDEVSAMYRPGDQLSGQIKVVVEEQVHCKGLILELYWQAKGKGSKSSGSVPDLNLFAGFIEAGEHYYPFSLDIKDDCPLTYEGDLFNLSWHLRASIDIPWAIDPVAVRIPTIVSPSGKKCAIKPLRQKQIQSAINDEVYKSSSHDDADMLGGDKTLMFVGGIVLFVAFPFINAFLNKIPGIGFIIFIAVLGFAIWKFIPFFIQKSQTLLYSQPLKSGPYQPNEPVDFRFKLTLLHKCYIKHITVGLIFIEESIDYSGDSNKSYFNKLLLAQQQLSSGRTGLANEVIEKDFQFKLPEYLIPTMNNGSNSTKWAIEIDVDFRLLPKLHMECPFVLTQAAVDVQEQESLT